MIVVTFLRSLAFAIVFWPGSVFCVGVSPVFAAMGRPAQIRWTYVWSRFHAWCVRWLLGIRCVVEGQVPPGPIIVAMKHEAMYETVQSFLILDRPAPVFKQELTKIPVWGRITAKYGVVVVDREGGARTMRKLLAEARALQAEGRPILIFPEGTRVPHGERRPIRPGVAGLYRMLGTPVVPIAVNSGRLWPKHRFLKRSGTITFRISEAIPAGLSRDELERRVLDAINVLND